MKTNLLFDFTVRIENNSIAELDMLMKMGFKKGFTMPMNELERILPMINICTDPGY